VNKRSELLKRSGEESSSLSLSSLNSSLLVCRLIEVGLHEAGAEPVLAEVSIRELVVVLNHLANLYIQ
jgi:hypothetical protein